MPQLTLAEMVTDLRAEVGHSLMGGQGTNMEDTLKYYIKRTQRELYAAYDWPQFIVDENVAYSAGDRYLPATTLMTYEQINSIWCRQGSEWYTMIYGINPDHYSLYNPENDVRGFPLQRWRANPIQNTVEVWPLPSIDGDCLVRGQWLLPDLVNDTDKSLLDGQLIVMFAAANMLAREKSEDASLVLQKGQQYLTSLQKNFGSQKRPMISLAGRADGGRRPRPGFDYIPRK